MSRSLLRFRTALLTLMAGCLLCGPALAQWKWRDANGRVQYSDLPPPAGVGEPQILQRPHAAAAAATAAAARNAASASGVAPASSPAASSALPAGKSVEPELEAKRRAAEQEKAAAKKAEDDKQAAARAQNCARAQGHLRAIDDGMRLSRVAPSGEREILDDKARGDEAARTKAIIAADCR